jgi:hypothetical protein
MLLKKALKLGATTLKRSNRKNKKWAVLYKNTWIHFGDSRYQDFTQHGDHIRRANYRKRHRAIRLKDGRLAYMVKTQPSFWAYNLIW